MAKLTKEQKAEIQRKYADGITTYRLSLQYDVCVSAIKRIVDSEYAASLDASARKINSTRPASYWTQKSKEFRGRQKQKRLAL